MTVLLWRIISAIMGIPLLLISVWVGGAWLFLVFAIVLIVSLLELHGIATKLQFKPSKVLMITGALSIYASIYASEGLAYVAPIITAFTFIALVITTFQKEYDISNIIFPVFSWVYPSISMGYIMLLRGISPTEGLYFAFMLLIITWASDSAAYFVGVNFGKNKLCPRISPKKSVEGCIGSFIITVLVLVLMNYIMTYFNTALVFSYEHVILLGVIGACLGQVGDLVESMLKRSAKVKDSGNIIPGHGGMLDRFDSLFFVAPGIYYFIIYFIM